MPVYLIIDCHKDVAAPGLHHIQTYQYRHTYLSIRAGVWCYVTYMPGPWFDPLTDDASLN
jgi:hypothetical protein